jgi:uncharacterized glyoxalase superfamily protein PhnB
MSGTQHYPISVILTSTDVKRSIAFYRDTLGFALEVCWPDENNPLWANMLLDGQSVMIGALMPPEAAHEGCSAEDVNWLKTQVEEFKKNRPGVGIQVYLKVDNVDEHHRRVTSKGAKVLNRPTDRFYGIRDFFCEDPDGYRLIFYNLISMTQCQSCGMPLANAAPGQMYCGYCTDEKGQLKPYEAVLEGTTQGYFMAMKKMPRPEAEKAAREHLSKMPAWATRKKDAVAR